MLSKGQSGQTAWHKQAEGHVELLQKLRDWAEELQLTGEEFSKLHLAVDNDSNTAMYGQYSYWRQCVLCVQGNTTEPRTHILQII